jgi:outer membrane murein-binding lipoprotein Lpp
MDKLMEHTLQRQNAELAAKVDKLTTLVEQMAAGQLALAPAGAGPAPRAPETRIEGQNQVAGGNINNSTTTVQNIQINITKPLVPWDGSKRIDVTAAQIAAAFEENARLKEYVRLEEHELTDPEIAPPYVAELLMDLTKRAHADPAARNVYLNPKRADQALVHMTSGKWEVMSLQEATRLIFDGVAKAMVRVTLSNEERRQLPLEAQNALAMAGLLYDDEPEEYAKKAKAPMAAHLSNTIPQLCQ